MDSKKVIETEKIDLEELISSFKVQDKKVFKSYLKDVWADLTERNSEKNVSGISKITFSSYYNLPGIINDRLFNVIDENKTGYLESAEFILGMITLFCEEFDENSKFIFNFYDFDKDGEISKEDIRIVLSYVSLIEDFHNYKDRVNSQEELYSIIKKCFEKIKGEKMCYKDFKKVIENVSSDIYLMILLFLYEKKPFTKATLLTYAKKDDKSPSNSPPHSPTKLVASPTKNSFSPYNLFKRERRRTATLKEFKSAISHDLIDTSPTSHKRSKGRFSTQKDNIISLIPTSKNVHPAKHSKFNSLNSNSFNNQNINDEHFSPIHRKNKKNLKNLSKGNSNSGFTSFANNYLQNSDKNINYNDIDLEPAFKQLKRKVPNFKDNETNSIISGELNEIKKGNNDKDKEKNKDDDLFFNHYDQEDSIDNEDDEKEEDINECEGYLIKFIDNKERKVWFRLVGKDLFFLRMKMMKFIKECII